MYGTKPLTPRPNADEAIAGSRGRIDDAGSEIEGSIGADSDLAGGKVSFFVIATKRSRACGFMKSNTDLPGRGASPRIDPRDDGSSVEDLANVAEDCQSFKSVATSDFCFDGCQLSGTFGGGYLFDSVDTFDTERMKPSNGNRPS